MGSTLLTVLRKSVNYTWCGCLLISAIPVFGASPTNQGQSGYINMPSAVTEADGTFSLGYSYDKPYGNLWATATVLPWLQVSGLYTSISGIQGIFAPGVGTNYGRYKDKAIEAKLRLWQEGEFLPSIAVGVNDPTGTGLFQGKYIVATKTFGQTKNIEASIGYGHKRPEGIFAGARWRPEALPHWALVAEYDANNYPKDFSASQTFAGERRKGPAVGVEYRWGWLGVQVARNRKNPSINAYVTIPFAEREYVPKIFEPAYFQPKDAPPKASIVQWQQNPSYGSALADALSRQDFKNVRVEQKGNTLNLALTNSRISNMGRAVGRAARTAVAFAPEGTRSLRITYTVQEQPFATYEFLDIEKLTDYLNSKINRDAFLQTVAVRYARPDDRITLDHSGLLAGVADGDGLGVRVGKDGNIVQLSSEDREANRFKIVPKFGVFLNDPSGAFRYELLANGNYDKRIGEGLYFNSAVQLTLFENVSGVTQESNSELPHVRSDIANYKRGGKFKIQRLLINQYLNPAEHWYARVSGGLYEEMFGGVGGQVLYAPKDNRWAADVELDALKQRGYRGLFDQRDYRTVTAIGSLHYRLPYDTTATLRAGRFLAKDVGVRMELKRHFLSGIEAGAWYTKTNGNDVQSPGAIGAPYHDKGIFLSIPLGAALPLDSQAVAGFSLSPWTRDVGQQVLSPGDLYDNLEKPRRDLSTADGLGNFAERADEKNLPAVNPPPQTIPNLWPNFQRRLQDSSSALPEPSDFVKNTGIAAGAVLLGAIADKKADHFFKNHANSRVVHGWDKVGKAGPYVAIGAAGLAFALGDNRLKNTGLIALESVAIAEGATTALKYAVNRARPSEELGSLKHSGDKRGNSSFPSGHSTAVFAAITPFAQEYNAPWLYGVAGFASAGRVAGREHWVSDAVAGGVIGYAVGSWLWQAQRNDSKYAFSINPGQKAIDVSWHKAY